MPSSMSPPRPTPARRPHQQAPPYTTLTPTEKNSLTFLLGLANLASPLTATIYLPLLPTLRTHFQTTQQAINLTITLYILFQALSPLFFATASDSYGRRPIVLFTFALYTLASLGLTLNQSSYAALLVLRALQSLGASAVLAISYGVVADVCVPAERGKMLGPVNAMGNLGVNIGPLVGGLLAWREGGFEWAFWCLVGYGGVTLLALAILLHETARSIVGNGSVEERGIWAKTGWNLLKERRAMSVKTGDEGVVTEEVMATATAPMTLGSETMHSSAYKRRLRFTNPLSSIAIIFRPEIAPMLWLAASSYAVYYCIQTSIPTIYGSLYGLNELQIGLTYLAGGGGVVLGGYLNGKLMDYNYRVTAHQIGHTVNRVQGDDIYEFPIERARARWCSCLLVASMSGFMGYGWTLVERVHISVPLILQFLHGVLCTCVLQTFNALLADVFPENPSTAATSGNITRCALSALYVALLEPLVDAMGRGWYFSMLGLVNGLVGLGAVWILRQWGLEWRRRKRQRSSRTEVETEVDIHDDKNGESGSPGLQEVGEKMDSATQD